jgi:hypothetical protein
MSKLIVAGNQFDGAKFYGPFADNSAAIDFAEQNIDFHWFVGDLGDVPAGYNWPKDSEIKRLRAALTTLAHDTFESKADMAQVAADALQGEAEPTLVIVGGPIGGFKYFGPFAGEEIANRFADEVHGHDTWWMTPLETAVQK